FTLVNFELFNLIRLAFMSLDNIKLASAGCLCRVDVVTQAGSRKRAFFVKKSWIDFGRNGISRATIAKVATRLDGLGIGIATLDHELLYDPVEQCAVEIMLLGKFDEIL